MSTYAAAEIQLPVQSCLAAMESASDTHAALRRLAVRDRSAFVQVACSLLQSWPTSGEFRCLISVLAGNEVPDALLNTGIQAVSQAAQIVRSIGALRSQVRTSLAEWLANETAQSPITHLAEILLAMDLLAGIDRSVTPPGLLELAKHDNEQIRSKAARLIDRENVQSSWRIQCLADPNGRVRANAIESMWGARDVTSADTFRTMLKDDQPRVVGNSIVGLFLAGIESDAQTELQNLARHPDARFRRAAAWVAGEIGQSEPLLNQLRGDTDPAVRLCALKSLARVRRSSGQTDHDQRRD